MDFKDNFARVNKWYEEIKKEYQEDYPKMELPDDRKKFLTKYKNILGEMKKEIDCLNAEVEFLDNESDKQDVYNQIRVFEMYIDELEGNWNRENYKDKNFDYTIFDKVTERQNQIAKINFEDKKNMDVQKLKLAAIEEGDKLYGEALDRLKSIKENIRVSSERLAAINEEIRQQNYKLLEIDDLIRESQNLFVRVKELISFFSKTFLKDKCLSLMIILLFVLCGAILVLIILEKAKGSDSTTTTDTTTPADTTAAAGIYGIEGDFSSEKNYKGVLGENSKVGSQLNIETNYLQNAKIRYRYQGTIDKFVIPDETAEERRLRIKAYDGIYGDKVKRGVIVEHRFAKNDTRAHIIYKADSLLGSNYKTVTHND